MNEDTNGIPRPLKYDVGRLKRLETGNLASSQEVAGLFDDYLIEDLDDDVNATLADWDL